jgi:rhamnogalacturonan endolyase
LVTVTEDDRTFRLFNGLVAAKIEKRTGTLLSLHYQGTELLAQDHRGSSGGYWSWVGSARPGLNPSATVTLDPATNGGSRAEVSCHLLNDPQNPKTSLDAEYRYSLGRGEHWLYVYAKFEHQPGYPPFSAAEGRYCLKLNPKVFDFLNVDANRRRIMPSGYDWDHGSPLNLKEARLMKTGIHKGEPEHKYDYSALFSDTPAYGWLSSRERLGLWLINPSLEYIGGGPTKAELTGHLDVNAGGLPILLNMWLGSHYGGTTVSVTKDEAWTKVVGPFLLYCNAASFEGGEKTTQVARDVLWQDALKRSRLESNQWPYLWVTVTDYVQATDRASLKGELALHDPFDPKLKATNLWVGLSAPDWTNSDRPGLAERAGFPASMDWQRDAKFYQFWSRADAQGRFEIRNIRPGTYTLHAFTDGVLGEFQLTNFTISAQENRSLGRLEWTPARFGRTLWQIGIPDRTAREFRHGDHYWRWGLYFDYAKEFPHDVNFTIGTSDWHRDWNYVQPPHISSRDVPVTGEDDEAAVSSNDNQSTSGRNRIEISTWTVNFTLTNPPQGKATLRLAFCGTTRNCNVEARVNGHRIGQTGPLPSTSAMQRDGIRGYWIEKDLGFDAAILQKGTNVLRLLSHAQNWAQGVMYDCLRLELNDATGASTEGEQPR